MSLQVQTVDKALTIIGDYIERFNRGRFEATLASVHYNDGDWLYLQTDASHASSLKTLSHKFKEFGLYSRIEKNGENATLRLSITEHNIDYLLDTIQENIEHNKLQSAKNLANRLAREIKTLEPEAAQKVVNSLITQLSETPGTEGLTEAILQQSRITSPASNRFNNR